jgi:hypothetical protein
MAGKSRNKTAGTAWEYNFFAKALERGLDVFIPAGDDLPVDCMIVNSAGTVYRVQCKGTSVNNKTKGEYHDRFKIIAGTGRSSKLPIDCTKVDIVACYIAPTKTWYLVPCVELEGAVSMWFYPNNPDSKSKYARFKDNWEIFKS